MPRKAVAAGEIMGLEQPHGIYNARTIGPKRPLKKTTLVVPKSSSLSVGMVSSGKVAILIRDHLSAPIRPAGSNCGRERLLYMEQIFSFPEYEGQNRGRQKVKVGPRAVEGHPMFHEANMEDTPTGNSWKSILKALGSWKIQVEPIILILSLCNTAVNVVSPHLNEAKMKRVYSAPPGLDHDEMKKFYNKKMVLWDQNYQYVNLPIACIAGIVYGAYSDRKGRKIPLLIGFISVFLGNTFNMLIWSEKTDISLHWLFLSAVIVGMMGDFMLLMSCVNAYLADQFGDKRMLSIRMVVVSIIFSLGSLCGSQTVDIFVDKIGEFGTLFVIQGILLVTFIISIFVLKNPLPEGNTEENENIVERKSLISSVIDQFRYLVNSLKIFIVEREGHRRLFLYLCFLANFLDQLTFGEETSLIGTYTRLDPFDWDTKQYSTYKTIRPIAQIIGMLFGLIVLKQALKVRDTLIIVFAIGSMALCILVIGLANSSAIIYASLAPGSLHGLLNPLTYTFITSLVLPTEIGQTFAVSTIAGKLAGIVQTAVLQTIYTHTVDWYQGFVWILMFFVSSIAAVLYFGVHIVAKRENIGT
ncbi:hypothetical protein FO519_006087 [Halicephalobus sp. NKZ332]|nr:hypothetical protein FO519_006087 [Halicephalobus sp. NKZ332]